MKIKLILVGKTEESWLKEGVANYTRRLTHYVSFVMEELPVLKNAGSMTADQQKEKEGELILKASEGAERLFLLDEKGKEYDSPAFSTFLQTQMNGGYKQIAFVVGGPFGFSEKLMKQAHGKISLSKMTFTHQMVRLFFVEQLYRAMTILRGEKYHHH